MRKSILLLGLVLSLCIFMFGCTLAGMATNTCNSQCSRSYSPVCGSDGNTYLNSCYANCNGVTSTSGYCTRGRTTTTLVPVTTTLSPIPVVDLSNYPEMFIKDNKFNGIIIVGTLGNDPSVLASDVIAVTDIVAGLQYYAASHGIDRIEIGAAKLDTEVSDLYAQNSIVVGKPTQNRFSAQLLGVAPGTPIEQTSVPKEKGLLKLFSLETGKLSLLVTGWDYMDTRNAAKALAADTNLLGQSMEISRSQGPCSDSDNGINIYSKGTCADVGGTNQDSCATGSDKSVLLSERYCNKINNRCDVAKDPMTNGYGIKCLGGCKDGACINIGKYTIADITGIKDSYSPGEKISVIIKGIEPDGSAAEQAEGFYVQYSFYKGDQGLSSGNADFDGSYWNVNTNVPSEPGDYYIRLSLYCYRPDMACAMRYGDDAQYDTPRQIRVVGDQPGLTKKDVLETLRVGSYGQCNFIEVPYGDKWDKIKNPYDYETEVLPFIKADVNGDTITTGSEYCDAAGSICLFGFRKQYLMVEGYGGGFFTTDQIGCWGGDSYENLAKPNAVHGNYYCCFP